MCLFANSGLVRVSQVKLPFHAAFSRLHCENRISFFGVSAKSQWIAGGCAGNRRVDPRLCAGPVLQVVCTWRAGGSSPSTNGVMQSALSVVWQVERKHSGTYRASLGHDPTRATLRRPPMFWAGASSFDPRLAKKSTTREQNRVKSDPV